MLCEKESLPQCIHLHSVHESIAVDIGEYLWLTPNAGIGEEYVQSAVLSNCFVDNRCQGLFVGGIELPHVNVYAWIQGLNLTLVSCEMRVGKVTDVDSFGAVVRELVGAGTANPVGRVCSYLFLLIPAQKSFFWELCKAYR